MFETEKRYVDSGKDSVGQGLGKGKANSDGLFIQFLKLFFLDSLRLLKGELLRSSGDVANGLYALVKEKQDPKEENRFFFLVKKPPKFSFVLPILNRG